MDKIGVFAKKNNISVKTIRYYNEIGLLIPEEVNLYSGYRFYGKKNQEEFKKILLLKEAGFTLEEIKDNWNSLNEEILLKKKKELYQDIKYTEKKIKKLDYLREITNNKKGVNKL